MSTSVLVLGANGQLARNTTRVLLRDTDAKLTLTLRRPSRLTNPDPARVRIIEGDVLDRKAVEVAMKGHDVVYANLAGAMNEQAERFVAAMHASGVKRLIFISSMGIYGEVPGERYRSVLAPYRDSAAVIDSFLGHLRSRADHLALGGRRSRNCSPAGCSWHADHPP